MSVIKTIRTQCCIAGGGPAGMMMGYLLARAGIDVVVLEKHSDFIRDFRGDTIHPSTLEIMHDLGLLDDLLKLPHQDIDRLKAKFGGRIVELADMSRLSVHHPYISFMPQWDFLNFLSERARLYPSFHLYMGTVADSLIIDNDVVTGVKARGPDGEIWIEADLTIGADGRRSDIREQAGMRPIDTGVPIDALWLRIAKTASAGDHVFGYFAQSTLLVVIDRGDYFQCAVVIPKGHFDLVKARGLDAFKATIVGMEPGLAEGLTSLTDWDQVKLLSVQIDHLDQWYRDGLLCIGDAAHAMSPAFGVGINLAVQDAVAAANILIAPLRNGRPDISCLRQVQDRRARPARWIQRLQVIIHNKLLNPHNTKDSAPFFAVFVMAFRFLPFMKYIVARVVGMGLRPERPSSPGG